MLEIRNAARMAKWVNRHLSLIAKHFAAHQSPAPFTTLDWPLNIAAHSIGFRADSARNDLIERIRGQFTDPNGQRHIRIT